jgi:ABC-2 type transport system permease protein
MVMWGLALPFFMFFSFSVRRGLAPQTGIARLLALTTFFTASSAGGVIFPIERRAGTYDRLQAAPMAPITILLSRSSVGAFFAVAISVLSLAAGWALFGASVVHPGLLALAVTLSAYTFSAMGILFASGSAQSPGQIMMPSTLLRWPLLFISGIFIPLEQMGRWARAVSYLSPLTYAQDMISHAVLGVGVQSMLLNGTLLLLLLVLFLGGASRLQRRIRRLGY